MSEAVHTAPSTKSIRIALVSTGLSHAQGSCEAFMLDLYEALQEVATVSLFKGSGWSAPPASYCVPSLARSNPWSVRLLGADEARRYRTEQVSFALAGWLAGHWRQFDIIHFCDPDFGNALYQLRKLFKYRYKLLFTNIGFLPPEAYSRMDHIQQLTPQLFEEAKKSIRKTRLSLNPMGIWPGRFNLEQDKAQLRAEWHIPDDKFVILCIGALDEPTKRIRFLIETLANLNDPGIHLVIAGKNRNSDYARETLSLAEASLPGRFQHVAAPSVQMAEIYRAGDLCVLPSTGENLGKIYMEAMASRLPMLCHDAPLTQWLVQAAESRVNMEDKAAVQAAIAAMREGACQSTLARQTAQSNHEAVLARYQWSTLRQEYLRMYESILFLPS